MKPVQHIFLLILFFTSACCQQPKQDEQSKFSGLWTLHIMEQYDQETGAWSVWRNGMQGYILYNNDGHMALHLTTAEYEDFDLEFSNFTDTIPLDALKHLTNSYVYFAKYTIDKEKGIVEHARISHSNPGMWNEIVQRKYTFIGDTLVLEPVEESIAGLRLKWIKAHQSNK